ncbi:hypothetical protein Tco_0530746 [Tanacetum coccineum]
MVLQLIVGLNKSYDDVKSFIQQSDPLPPFYVARSRLVLEKTRKNKLATNSYIASRTTLVVVVPSTTLNPKHQNNPTSSSNSPNTSPQRNKNFNRGRGRNNRSRGGGHNGGQGRGRSTPWSRPTPLPFGSQGILGPRPTQTYVASTVPTELDQAFNTMSLNSPDDQWYMETGAISYMATSPCTFSSYLNLSIPKRILIGNGYTILIYGYEHMYLPSSYLPLHLKNVLHVPHLIKNLIFIRHLSIDNNLTISFDPYGFSVYNFQIWIPIMSCNSIGDLYPIMNSTLQLLTSPSTFDVLSQDLWHHRLGHPGANDFQENSNDEVDEVEIARDI